MHTDILSLFGYLASVIIAASMTLNSIVKFRWVNMAGAFSFAMYGLLIHAIPVTFLNGFIVLVDIYYLTKIYSAKEVFQILEVRHDNKYLLEFMRFHEKEIHRFFPEFDFQPEMNTVNFFVLRNMNVAGVFLAHRENNNVLHVGLDFVVPEYRDFKNGKFIYSRLRGWFMANGFRKVVAPSDNKKYGLYLKKLGFQEASGGTFTKDLTES